MLIYVGIIFQAVLEYQVIVDFFSESPRNMSLDGEEIEVVGPLRYIFYVLKGTLYFNIILCLKVKS